MTGAGQGARDAFSKALLAAINAHFACGEHNDDSVEGDASYSKLATQADEATDEVERLYTALLREVEGLKAALNDPCVWIEIEDGSGIYNTCNEGNEFHLDEGCELWPHCMWCGKRVEAVQYDAALSPASGGV